MPKKKKKEKILALYHRKIRLLENKQTSTAATTPTTPSPAPIIPITNLETKVSPLNQYFFSDLKKSLILITLIISLEISFYFAKLIK